MIVQMFIQIVAFSSFRYIFRSGMAKSFDDLCLIIWGTPILFDTTERHHLHFSLSCIGEGHGNPLQSSCLENPKEGGAWWAAVYRVAQSRTWLKRLSSSSNSSILFDTAVEQFYNATSIEKRFQSLHILTNTFNFLVFWLIAIKMDTQQHLIVVLICISLLMHNVGYLFISLFAICLSSLMRCLLKSLTHLFNWFLFSYCWVLRVLSIFWVTVFYQMCLLQIFYPQSVACLPFLTLSFSKQKFLTLMNSSLSIIFHGSCLWYCTYSILLPQWRTLLPHVSIGKTSVYLHRCARHIAVCIFIAMLRITWGQALTSWNHAAPTSPQHSTHGRYFRKVYCGNKWLDTWVVQTLTAVRDGIQAQAYPVPEPVFFPPHCALWGASLRMTLMLWQTNAIDFQGSYIWNCEILQSTWVVKKSVIESKVPYS